MILPVMPGLLSFATSRLGLVLMASVVAFGGGWKARDVLADAAADKLALAHEKALTDALARNLRGIQRADAITADVGSKSAARQVEIRTVYEEITRDVPVYVTVAGDAGCVVPNGFVRVHDRAASGSPAVPEPAGASNDAPSGVALSTVATTVSGNYGTCVADQSRLAALQEWVRRQAEAWNAEP